LNLSNFPDPKEPVPCYGEVLKISKKVQLRFQGLLSTSSIPQLFIALFVRQESVVSVQLKLGESVMLAQPKLRFGCVSATKTLRLGCVSTTET
jgi:hypothetical protein